MEILPWLQEFYQESKSYKLVDEDHRYPNTLGLNYHILLRMQFRLVNKHHASDVALGTVYGLIDAVIDAAGQAVVKREYHHGPEKMNIATREDNHTIRLGCQRWAEAEFGWSPARSGARRRLTHHVRGQRKKCPVCGVNSNCWIPFVAQRADLLRFVAKCASMIGESLRLAGAVATGLAPMQ